MNLIKKLRSWKKSSLETKLNDDEAMVWEMWGIMLKSGVPILQSLNILKSTFPAYTPLISAIHEGIKQGESITQSIVKYAPAVRMHPLALPYLAAGENSGGLPELCTKLSKVISQTNTKKEKSLSDDTLKKIGFYTCLNDLESSGIPRLRILHVMKNSSNYLPKEVYTKIEEDVEGGESFAYAVSRHKAYFGPLEISMLEVGEETDALQAVCANLSELIINEARIENKHYPQEEKRKIKFYMQLAAMCDAGFPLLRGLREIGKNPAIMPKKVIDGLSGAIEYGATFSEALSQYPKIFSTFELNMARAGECAGVLEITLQRTAEYLQKAAENKYG